MRARGFTLLEVLVALVIIGVALAASMRGAMSLTSTAEYSRDKLLALLTAENRLLELRLARERLEPGEEILPCEQGGIAFTCVQAVKPTPNPFFRRVEVDREANTLVWPNGVDFCPDVLYHEATGAPLPLTGGISLDLSIDSGTYAGVVTVLASATNGLGAGTTANAGISDLVLDINKALQDAGLGAVIRVQDERGVIVFVSDYSFTITSDAADNLDQLGFGLGTLSSVLSTPDYEVAAGTTLPANGVLTGDVTVSDNVVRLRIPGMVCDGTVWDVPLVNAGLHLRVRRAG